MPNFLVVDAAHLFLRGPMVGFHLPTNGGTRILVGQRLASWILPAAALGHAPMTYLRANRARLGARDAQPGLHPDREGEGVAPAPRGRAAHPAQLADSRRDRAAPLLGFLITGSFIVEFIFGIPGIGRYFVTSVTSRDYSVTMGITVMLSVIVIVANIVVDILYGFLDPRTRDART